MKKMRNLKLDNLVSKIIKAPFTTNENYIEALLRIKNVYSCDYSALNVAFNFGYVIGKLERKNNEQRS